MSQNPTNKNKGKSVKSYQKLWISHSGRFKTLCKSNLMNFSLTESKLSPHIAPIKAVKNSQMSLWQVKSRQSLCLSLWWCRFWCLTKNNSRRSTLLHRFVKCRNKFQIVLSKTRHQKVKNKKKSFKAKMQLLKIIHKMKRYRLKNCRRMNSKQQLWSHFTSSWRQTIFSIPISVNLQNFLKGIWAVFLCLKEVTRTSWTFQCHLICTYRISIMTAIKTNVARA